MSQLLSEWIKGQPPHLEGQPWRVPEDVVERTLEFIEAARGRILYLEEKLSYLEGHTRSAARAAPSLEEDGYAPLLD